MRLFLILCCGLFVTAAAAEDPGYEMTTYYVVFLYKGEAWTAESTPETEAIQKAHLQNIERLANEGSILLAGPFLHNGDLRGMFVFVAESQEEVEAHCKNDPAVQAGRLRTEVYPWYSVKGITYPGRPVPEEK